MRKLRAAFRTNEIQAVSVGCLTTLNVAACFMWAQEWYVWIAAALIWPAFAFVGNLVDPINAQFTDHRGEATDHREKKP